MLKFESFVLEKVYGFWDLLLLFMEHKTHIIGYIKIHLGA